MFNLETREFVNFESYEKQNTVKRVTIFTYIINRYIIYNKQIYNDENAGVVTKFCFLILRKFK